MPTFTVHSRKKQIFQKGLEEYDELVTNEDAHDDELGEVYFYKFKSETSYTLMGHKINKAVLDRLKKNTTPSNSLVIYKAGFADFQMWCRRRVIQLNSLDQMLDLFTTKQSNLNTASFKPIGQDKNEDKMDIKSELGIASSDGFLFNADDDAFWTVFQLDMLMDFGKFFVEFCVKHFQAGSSNPYVIKRLLSVEGDNTHIKTALHSHRGAQFVVAYWKVLIFFHTKDVGNLKKSLEELFAVKINPMTKQIKDKSTAILNSTAKLVGNFAGFFSEVVSNAAVSVKEMAMGTPQSEESKASSKNDEGWDDFDISGENKSESKATSKETPDEVSLSEGRAMLMPCALWMQIAEMCMPFKESAALEEKTAEEKIAAQKKAAEEKSATVTKSDKRQSGIFSGRKVVSEKEIPWVPKTMFDVKKVFVLSTLSGYVEVANKEINDPLHDKYLSAMKQELLFAYIDQIKTSCHTEKKLFHLLTLLKFTIQNVTAFFGHEPKQLSNIINEAISGLAIWDALPPKAFKDQVAAFEQGEPPIVLALRIRC